jgi:phosphohistidine swiveling domain-containing protein
VRDLLRKGWPGEPIANPVDGTTLHLDVPNGHAWSRANLAEAMPGVSTPLSWEFTAPSSTTTARFMFALMGVVSARELNEPLASAADAATTVYYGRAALNVDVMRRYVARVPGADPDQFEQQLLGRSRGSSTEPRQRWRLPVVLVRLPWNVARFKDQTDKNAAQTAAWWTEQIDQLATADLDRAVAIFEDAVQRHVDLVGVHSFGIIVGQGFYSALTTLCAHHGVADIALDLSGSGEGTVETEIVDDIARLASGSMALERFLAVHGFRGPDEGELSARSWREDAGPILRLVDLYAKGKTSRGPAAVRRHEQARSALLEALPWWKRPIGARLVTTVNRYMKLREVGKASFVRARDVGRAAARRIGDLHTAAGRLDDPDDVFLLTRAELGQDRPLHSIVAQRRARRAELEAIDLPDDFTGIPRPVEPTARAPHAAAGDVITGVPASGGSFEGTARVLASPDDLDGLADDDVLVCELTDPAWAPLLQLAGAVVIDIGGALSHGAIVARELGIPAVIGTTDGTRRIPDGARVRVDGTAGEVVILEAARTTIAEVS